MFTLATTNTIAANASASSALACTIFGMELNTSTQTEVYKILYQDLLPAVPSTLYTVPSTNEAFVKTIVISNNTTNDVTFVMYVNGTANSNKVTPVYNILQGGQAVYEDGKGWSFYTQSGILLNGASALPPADKVFFVSGCLAETFPRKLVPEINTAALLTGRLTLESLYIPLGTVISSISFWSATTAINTPTNQIFGLYDNNLTLLASSVNDGATAWAANTRKTLNLTAPFTTTYSGIYYLGIMVTATTVPTLKGYAAVIGGQLRGAIPILGGISTTGLTTILPNPAAPITVSTTPIWGCVN